MTSKAEELDSGRWRWRRKGIPSVDEKKKRSNGKKMKR
jgi:hypothetical protein